jgi:hypothetical protein
MNDFLGKMRKFLVRSAQVLKIKLKMRVVLITDYADFTEIYKKGGSFFGFLQILLKICNCNLRAFGYSGIWYLLTTDFTNPRLREDKFRSKSATTIPDYSRTPER